jgi:hypothetical protein
MFNLPSDEFGRVAQLPPNTLRVGAEAPFTVSTSTVEKTVIQGEYIEIQADTASVFFKWGTDDCTTANADGRVIFGTNHNRFIVPNGITAINFITASGSASVILIRQ